ncbi:hypothetical protein KP509_20G089100 [Ceratopteris richardii]|uniref:Uncharacterized protein n=1 Tax=Ceratopteris richardii TaxID=49495 RepID=A0A8T2SHY4_CERRI|nr:hypothetical protein KP509_20G089100 [Ceratopteris richardii]
MGEQALGESKEIHRAGILSLTGERHIFFLEDVLAGLLWMGHRFQGHRACPLWVRTCTHRGRERLRNGGGLSWIERGGRFLCFSIFGTTDREEDSRELMMYQTCFREFFFKA